MQIGTIFAGRIAGMGSESIQTKFFMLGLPILPLESYYAVQDTGRGISGIPIPMSAKSALLGLARYWLLVPMVLGIIFGLLEDEAAYLAMGVGAIVGWVALTFVVGRPSARERRQRRVLAMGTGTYARPEWLPVDLTLDTLGELKAKWTALGADRAPDDWMPDHQGVPADLGQQVLLYAIARYAHRTEGLPGWQALAERCWQAIDRKWEAVYAPLLAA
ncbi:MAG: hypothetical protein ACK2U9_07500 [Anaerolineae bacterium]